MTPQPSFFTQSAADLPLFSGTPVPATESAYRPEPESNIEALQLFEDENEEAYHDIRIYTAAIQPTARPEYLARAIKSGRITLAQANLIAAELTGKPRTL